MALLTIAGTVRAQELLPDNAMSGPTTAPIPFNGDQYGALFGEPPIQMAPPSNAWIAPPSAQAQMVAPAPCNAEPDWGQPVIAAGPPGAWYWQVIPKSVIYHSYLAGMHEPRLGIIAERETKSEQTFWDGTLGGRVGVLRYGTGDGIMPQGFELDVEAAAMVRLTLDNIGDFETADYRYGVPLTYGIDNWQFKLAAYHLSSHLGDEFIISHPGSLDDRINYVRNEAVLGASYYPQPFIRLYGEAGWSFYCDGGSEPWEFQFGTELSQPGPTGSYGTPFLAINANLRQELDFGGDINTEAGWLWRNETGQVMRLGLHYFNGKSSQFETFNNFEQQIGFGVWYDF